MLLVSPYHLVTRVDNSGFKGRERVGNRSRGLLAEGRGARPIVFRQTDSGICHDLAMSEWAIDVERLSRSFGSGANRFAALRDVSFQVPQGELVALLGENGAGKTTLTKVLATLLLPTSGSARVLGYDVVAQSRGVRIHTSTVLGGDRGLYGRLSALDNLRFFSMLAGVSHRDTKIRAQALLEEVGLGESANKRVEGFSKGMRQRLHIAIGLISRPAVLLLDEPTVGLDPIEAQRLRVEVGRLQSEGITVLLTSHYLLDVERLASRVLLMDRGELRADLGLDAFREKAGFSAAIEIVGRGVIPAPSSLAEVGVLSAHEEAEGLDFRLELKVRSWHPDVFAAVGRAFAECEIQAMEVRAPSLEEAFAAFLRDERSDTK